MEGICLLWRRGAFWAAEKECLGFVLGVRGMKAILKAKGAKGLPRLLGDGVLGIFIEVTSRSRVLTAFLSSVTGPIIHAVICWILSAIGLFQCIMPSQHKNLILRTIFHFIAQIFLEPLIPKELTKFQPIFEVFDFEF